MRTKTKQIALCSMLAALGTAVMCVDSFIPIGLYACPMLASLAAAAAREEAGTAFGWMTYTVISLLSLMLCTDKECAALFLFLGYYPLIQPWINQRFRIRPLRIAVKGILYALAIGLMYALLLFVLGLTSVAEEFGDAGLWMSAALFAAGAGLFALYDRSLIRALAFYRYRRKKKYPARRTNQ